MCLHCDYKVFTTCLQHVYHVVATCLQCIAGGMPHSRPPMVQSLDTFTYGHVHMDIYIYTYMDCLGGQVGRSSLATVLGFVGPPTQPALQGLT